MPKEKICCVYHFMDDSGCTVYIGCSKDYETRIKQHLNKDRKKYNTWFYRWLNKQIAFEIPFFWDILEICTEENYKEREIYWIKEARECNIPITNLTDGGDGNNNQFFSKESIEKRAQKLRGRKHSEETKKRLSEMKKGKIVSQQTREKLRNHFLGTPCPQHVIELLSKPIIQMTLEGEFIEEFPSLSDAAKSINTRKGSLSNAMKKKVTKFKGFLWKWKN